MAQQSLDNGYFQIISELKARRYHSVYFLMGDEPYFIDAISNCIEKNVLSETEREFNLTVLYGSDTTMAKVIDVAKRYPMMSDYQVVIVKEAQSLFKKRKRSMDDNTEGSEDEKNSIIPLEMYMKSIVPTTILVFCCKYGTIEKKSTWKSNEKVLYFQSNPIYESQISSWITNYVKQKNIDINFKAIELLATYEGTNLTQIVNDLEKLMVSCQNSTITIDDIEQNIGINKLFNNFELQSAVADKDYYKALQIVTFFSKNPKANPIFITISMLFKFFYNMMIYYYTDSSIVGKDLANRLGFPYTNDYALKYKMKDYISAKKNYKAIKCMKNIELLREYNAKAVGVDSTASQEDLYKELIFRLMH